MLRRIGWKSRIKFKLMWRISEYEIIRKAAHANLPFGCASGFPTTGNDRTGLIGLIGGLNIRPAFVCQADWSLCLNGMVEYNTVQYSTVLYCPYFCLPGYAWHGPYVPMIDLRTTESLDLASLKSDYAGCRI